MKKCTIIITIALLMMVVGCGGNWTSAGLGAAGGAVAGAGGYEYHLNKERQRVENDYREGRIDKKEYDIRIDQINRDSILK